MKVSGGIFRDMTIHDFDMARFFLGDIVEVHAFGQNFNEEIKAAGDFDAAVVTLKNADGVVATIVNNRKCPAGYDQRLEVQGSTGTLNADNIRATTVRLSNAEVTDAAEPYLDFFLQRYADAYRLELTAFIDAVVAGTKPTLHRRCDRGPAPGRGGHGVGEDWQARITGLTASRESRRGSVLPRRDRLIVQGHPRCISFLHTDVPRHHCRVPHTC